MPVEIHEEILYANREKEILNFLIQEYEVKFSQAYVLEDLENPEKEPFKHKYEARKIFEDLLETITTKFKKELDVKH